MCGSGRHVTVTFKKKNRVHVCQADTISLLWLNFRAGGSCLQELGFMWPCFLLSRLYSLLNSLSEKQVPGNLVLQRITDLDHPPEGRNTRITFLLLLGDPFGCSQAHLSHEESSGPPVEVSNKQVLLTASILLTMMSVHLWIVLCGDGGNI